MNVVAGFWMNSRWLIREVVVHVWMDQSLKVDYCDYTLSGNRIARVCTKVHSNCEVNSDWNDVETRHWLHGLTVRLLYVPRSRTSIFILPHLFIIRDTLRDRSFSYSLQVDTIRGKCFRILHSSWMILLLVKNRTLRIYGTALRKCNKNKM